jgi:hypothetical protein
VVIVVIIVVVIIPIPSIPIFSRQLQIYPLFLWICLFWAFLINRILHYGILSQWSFDVFHQIVSARCSESHSGPCPFSLEDGVLITYHVLCDLVPSHL